MKYLEVLCVSVRGCCRSGKYKSVKRQADNVLVQHYYIIIIIKYDT